MSRWGPQVGLPAVLGGNGPHAGLGFSRAGAPAAAWGRHIAAKTPYGKVNAPMCRGVPPLVQESSGGRGSPREDGKGGRAEGNLNSLWISLLRSCSRKAIASASGQYGNDSAGEEGDCIVELQPP